MSEYVTRPGDTFETIARREFGTEDKAGEIKKSNPGVFEPLTAGLTLFSVDTNPPASIAPSDDPDETVLIIGGDRFRFWESIRVTSLLDGISSVQFTAPFDPNDKDQKDKFKPFSYKDVQVHIGGKLRFRGTIIQTVPNVSPSGRTITVQAYAKAGVLHDCTAPASAYPLEFDNVGLQQIAEEIIRPFGLKAVFEASPGAIFERVALNPGQPVFPFLVDLAQQRNLICGNNENGDLVFKKSEDGAVPVAVLSDDQPPVVSVAPSFNQQQFYSHITGIEPTVIGLDGSQVTKQNTKLRGVLRPHTFITNDTDGADVQQVVDAKTSRMYGDMVNYALTVNTWRDAFGDLWEPGTSIALTAPGAMIYKQYTFIIRAVSFSKSPATNKAILTLVLPGSYEGKIPGALPWD